MEEQLFTRDEVYYADEAFFSGTAAELTPIRELDNRTIGEGHAGPVTKAFRRLLQGDQGAGSPLRPLADQLQVLKPPTGEGNLPRSGSATQRNPIPHESRIPRSPLPSADIR